jgi:hypothetical protein
LTLNLANQHRQIKEKRENGRTLLRRANRNHD